MARSSNNDPLERFRFAIHVYNGDVDVKQPDGTIKIESTFKVAAFHECQMPKRVTTKAVYREGNNPNIKLKFPGISDMEDITLSRGIVVKYLKNSNGDTVINDIASEFYDWAQAVHAAADTDSRFMLKLKGAIDASGTDHFRKHLDILILGRDGTPKRGWRIFNAWPVAFSPSSDLNASEDGNKAIETLTLTYEDFIELNEEGLKTWQGAQPVTQ